MEWLNYHHLHYFWMTAREGTIARAAARLRLSQPTISGQIKLLEERLGAPLFERRGRGLALTDTGRVVARYADEIFALGAELVGAVEGSPQGRHQSLRVGISEVVPKLIAHRVLAPAVQGGAVHLECIEDKTERLLAELSLGDLHLVIADTSVPAGSPVKAFSHLLGECGVTFFAVEPQAKALRRGFPESLDGAPMLLPRNGTPLRRSIDRWLAEHRITPRIVAEFDDSALMKVFGEHGEGVFPAPAVVEADVRERYRVAVVGRASTVRERFYAITAVRRIEHPVAQRIATEARARLFTERRRRTSK